MILDVILMLGIFTKGLQDRINNQSLQNDENDFIKVFDGCVNEYLENRDNHFLDFFITTADGDFLDLHGNLSGLKRRENEDDDTFRQRILTDETLIQRTTDFNKLDIALWVYRTGVQDNNTLTSRNTYLKDLHDDDYVFICSGVDIQYLQEKFLLNDILFVD